MCTVIFLPTKEGVLISSNRDESALREKAIPPITTQLETLSYSAPIDPKGLGTWVGLNNFGNIIVLLNGGSEFHLSKPPYRKSRGLIVKEMLQSELPLTDWNMLPLEGVEPFTLVVWTEGKLFHLIWDGSQKHRNKLDAQMPHIWSSSTLYTEEAKNVRASLFYTWYEKSRNEIDPKTLMDFILSYQERENGFVMHRAQVETLSISMIDVQDRYYHFQYYDLESRKVTGKMSGFFQMQGIC